MGYTQHWKFRDDIAPAEFENGADKFEKAAHLGVKLCDKVRSLGIEICGGDGYGNPAFSRGKVVFNGSAEKREDYETFAMAPNDGVYNFCKTSEKPYDLLVCLMLLAFKHFFGEDFIYWSDGITKEDYDNRESNTYWKKIGFVPKGVDKGWQKAYEVWEEVKREEGIE
jgi:hypothetical protein